MATNYDDHAKNFSFRLKQKGTWELSPAYDVCYAYDPANIWVSQHTLSINGKHKDINTSDLMKIADANHVAKGEKIIKDIKETVCTWQKYADRANVSPTLQDSIAKTLIAPKF